jgi:hypothetical protein
MLDDAKTRHVCRDPFMFRIEAGNAFAGIWIWIFEEALTIIGDPPGIQLVVEYPVPPQPVSVDRRGVPSPSARTRDAITV